MLRVADQQILVGSPATLNVTLVDQLGEPRAATGALTVGIVDSDGAVIQAPGGATTGGSSPYSFASTAVMAAQLGVWTCTWTEAGTGATHVTVVEVIGGFYFTVAEARAAIPDLADTTTYPTATIQQVRREVEEEFEQITKLSFVPRYVKDTFHVAQPGAWLWLHRQQPIAIRSVINYLGDAWTAGDIANVTLTPEGRMQALRFFVPPVTVGFTHGLNRPPEAVKRAAMSRLRYHLNKGNSGIPDRATSFTVTDAGTYRLDTPDAFSTGMPDVDAVLGRYGRRGNGIG